MKVTVRELLSHYDNDPTHITALLSHHLFRVRSKSLSHSVTYTVTNPARFKWLAWDLVSQRHCQPFELDFIAPHPCEVIVRLLRDPAFG